LGYYFFLGKEPLDRTYPGKFSELSNFVGYGISRSVVEGVDPQEALDEVAGNLRTMLGQ